MRPWAFENMTLEGDQAKAVDSGTLNIKVIVDAVCMQWQALGQQECRKVTEGFPGGAVVESLPAKAGDTGSSPGLGRSHMPRSN